MPYNNSNLNLLQDREYIRAHGEVALWYAGTWCSCTTVNQQGAGIPATEPDPSQADPTCLACGGTGYLYPVAGKYITGVVSSVIQDEDLRDIGLRVNGELVFSQDPGGERLSNLDLLKLPNWTEGIPSFGQLVWRGSGASDALYYNVLQVDGIWTVDPSTGAITAYALNTDFTFSGRTLTWLAGHGPAAGAAYSIRYYPIYEWVVFVPPMPRYERGTDLGQKVILRRRHIVLPNAPNLLES